MAGEKITVRCQCGKRFRADAANAGRRVNCPDCGQLLAIWPEGSAELRQLLTQAGIVGDGAGGRARRVMAACKGGVKTLWARFPLWLRVVGVVALTLWLDHLVFGWIRDWRNDLTYLEVATKANVIIDEIDAAMADANCPPVGDYAFGERLVVVGNRGFGGVFDGLVWEVSYARDEPVWSSSWRWCGQIVSQERYEWLESDPNIAARFAPAAYKGYGAFFEELVKYETERKAAKERAVGVGGADSGRAGD